MIGVEYWIQFGALGIVGYIVVDQKRVTNKLIENNTKALTMVYEVISGCPKRKKKSGGNKHVNRKYIARK